MSLVVEDGTGLSYSESYISVAEADTLLIANRGEAEWLALTQGAKEDALRAATEFLDIRYRWYGQTKFAEQALQWPRTKVYNSKGRIFEGTVPKEVKKATADLAVAAVVESGLYNVVLETGALKQYFTDGLNVIFDPKTTGDAQLRGKRLVEIELLLKNMGTFIDVDWIEEDKTTVVRR